jgi:hypothetical protein
VAEFHKRVRQVRRFVWASLFASRKQILGSPQVGRFTQRSTFDPPTKEMCDQQTIGSLSDLSHLAPLVRIWPELATLVG